MKILICHDGSEQAERALRMGASIAAGCAAEVTLLGIVEAPEDSKPLLEALQRGQNLLQEKKVAYELISKSGDPIAEIVQRTEKATYDLVIIGAAWKQPAGRFWMSAKSYKIIKEIKPAVLSVSGENVRLKRILICSGGKRYINNAVHLAGDIARGVGSAVSLLHVLPELPPVYAGMPRVEQTAELLLNSQSELGVNLRYAKETLESCGIPVDVRLRQGGVLDQILRELHDGDYDLVVTGSALSRSLRTYVLGDITREIVNRANRAVLVVRSQETAAPTRFKMPGWLGRRSPAHDKAP